MTCPLSSLLPATTAAGTGKGAQGWGQYRRGVASVGVSLAGSWPCRDFAFVASDKDTCVLKCHVFHCNVPAKGIAKALHEMCSKVGCRAPGGCEHGLGISGVRGGSGTPVSCRSWPSELWRAAGCPAPPRWSPSLLRTCRCKVPSPRTAGCSPCPLPACEPEPSGLSGSFPGVPGDTAGDTGVAPPLPS